MFVLPLCPTDHVHLPCASEWTDASGSSASDPLSTSFPASQEPSLPVLVPSLTFLVPSPRVLVPSLPFFGAFTLFFGAFASF